MFGLYRLKIFIKGKRSQGHIANVHKKMTWYIVFSYLFENQCPKKLYKYQQATGNLLLCLSYIITLDTSRNINFPLIFCSHNINF